SFSDELTIVAEVLPVDMFVRAIMCIPVSTLPDYSKSDKTLHDSARRLLHSRHHFAAGVTAPSFEAGAPAHLSKERPYLRSIEVRESLHPDVTHPFAAALEDAGRIVEVDPTRERERQVSSEDANLADAVGDDVLGCAVQQHDLRAHLEDVLMARGEFLTDDGPHRESERLDRRVVPVEEFEQLARRLRHELTTNYTQNLNVFS